MPKEIIRSKYPEESGHIHVGWTKDCSHVEVATVVPRGQIAPWDEQEQRHVPLITPDPGWFIQLDREQINDLIRKLRKARDQAFGADA